VLLDTIRELVQAVKTVGVLTEAIIVLLEALRVLAWP
jgi:hypothetical protein